jgi:hypothetical protein
MCLPAPRGKAWNLRQWIAAVIVDVPEGYIRCLYERGGIRCTATYADAQRRGRGGVSQVYCARHR